MSPNEALDRVFDFYKIKNEDIAKKTGVHKSIISKYRNGHSDMGTHKLQKILRVIPPQAAQHFSMLWLYDIDVVDNLNEGRRQKAEGRRIV